MPGRVSSPDNCPRSASGVGAPLQIATTGKRRGILSGQPRVKEDDRVLAGQVLALVRDSMLDIVIRPLAGFSWTEIGAQRHEDPHALNRGSATK